MADWFLNLPVPGMALIVFAATFLIAGGVYLVVTRLADTEWATAFKAVSPGLLPVLGVLFALLVGFIAVEVWNTFDKAKTAVATEASALRAVVLLARHHHGVPMLPVSARALRQIGCRRKPSLASAIAEPSVGIWELGRVPRMKFMAAPSVVG